MDDSLHDYNTINMNTREKKIKPFHSQKKKRFWEKKTVKLIPVDRKMCFNLFHIKINEIFSTNMQYLWNFDIITLNNYQLYISYYTTI